MKNIAIDMQKDNNRIILPHMLTIDTIIASYKQFASMFKLQF